MCTGQKSPSVVAYANQQCRLHVAKTLAQHPPQPFIGLCANLARTTLEESLISLIYRPPLSPSP